MDKLKIVKTIVALLTFGVVFVFCLLISQTVASNKNKAFDINIKNAQNSVIDSFSANGKYVYIKTLNQLHVVDVDKGVYKGVIYVKGDN